jgi:hypothetical protein
MSIKIIDQALLEQQLATLISHYHAPSTRYRNLAFSSKNFLILDELADSLQKLLPHYSFWNGNAPETTQAPAAPCYRKQFIAEVFQKTHNGLIIQYPHYWLQHWTILEKQAFWSTLSTVHGGHNVIVIFTEGNDFASINQHYFTPQPLESTAATLWVSTKTALV